MAGVEDFAYLPTQHSWLATETPRNAIPMGSLHHWIRDGQTFENYCRNLAAYLAIYDSIYEEADAEFNSCKEFHRRAAGDKKGGAFHHYVVSRLRTIRLRYDPDLAGLGITRCVYSRDSVKRVADRIVADWEEKPV